MDNPVGCRIVGVLIVLEELREESDFGWAGAVGVNEGRASYGLGEEGLLCDWLKKRGVGMCSLDSSGPVIIASCNTVSKNVMDSPECGHLIARPNWVRGPCSGEIIVAFV